MRQILLLASAATAAAGLTACSSGMTKTECVNADWGAYGVEDGERGLSLAALNDRAAQCGKHGLRVGGDAYRRGRDVGLRAYCSPTNGFTHGEAYRVYRGQCFDHGEIAYLAAYDEGVAAHLVRRCTYTGGVTVGERGEPDDGRCQGSAGQDDFGRGYADGTDIARLQSAIANARRTIEAADRAVAEAERLGLRFARLGPDHVDFGKTERRWAAASERADRAVRSAYGAERDLLEAERALAYLRGRIDGRADR